jgi:signal peptidase I
MVIARSVRRPAVSHWRWGFWSFVLGAVIMGLPFRGVSVIGNSMFPTLQDGQRVLVDRAYYRLTGLFRNDIVVLQHDGETWVKRLIGLPGDRLALLYGTEGEIESVVNLQNGSAPPPGSRIITVPPNYLYVLGDNPPVSHDSRSVGPLPLTDLIGVVRTRTLGRVFPLPATP